MPYSRMHNSLVIPGMVQAVANCAFGLSAAVHRPVPRRCIMSNNECPTIEVLIIVNLFVVHWLTVNFFYAILQKAGQHMPVKEVYMKKINTAGAVSSGTKTYVSCALFAALTCVIAPVSIPLPGGVPITLQQITVMLAGLLLGPKLGFLSQLVYVLLGAFGLPVFAGFTGGFDKIAGPSGGFLIGYPFLALICGLIYWTFGRKQSGLKKYLVLAAAMLLGNIFLYILGLGFFMFNTGSNLASALTLCMIPFIPGDLLKMVITALLLPTLEKALRAAHVTDQL